MKTFRVFGETPWAGDRPIAGPVPTRKNKDIYTFLEWD